MFGPFWPRLASKFEKRLIRAQILFKTSVRVSKNAEFYADFEKSCKKVNVTKVINKKVK
jgi:hypothetical protein